ncbi:hypothetical protein AB3Y40_10520 [Yoonia sp. R2331]|uniref:hypothetical protein n=1 Tax=Yoonia sp. R2331 TaxID=3237238 RepID=UPI0034E450BF
MINVHLINASFVQTHCDQYSSSEAGGPSDVGKGFDEVWLQQGLVFCDLHGLDLSVIHSGNIDWLHTHLRTDVIAMEETFVHLLTLIT